MPKNSLWNCLNFPNSWTMNMNMLIIIVCHSDVCRMWAIYFQCKETKICLVDDDSFSKQPFQQCRELTLCYEFGMKLMLSRL